MSNQPINRSTLVDLSVFFMLVAIGVAGRAEQPVWNFTPIAAVALFAGAYFDRRWVAVMVPLAAMLVSNLWLPGYRYPAVMLSVYVMLVAPALAGPWLRRSRVATTCAWVGRLAAGAVAPSLAFFVVTNFAEWAFGAMYAKTPAGLVECYAAALPFYRQMLAGDAFYVAMLFGAAALAGVPFAVCHTQAARQPA